MALLVLLWHPAKACWLQIDHRLFIKPRIHHFGHYCDLWVFFILALGNHQFIMHPPKPIRPLTLPLHPILPIPQLPPISINCR